MILNKDPWPHIIQEDFLNPEDFSHFYELSKSIHQKIVKHPDNLWVLTLDGYREKYDDVLIEYLEILAPDKLEHYNHLEVAIYTNGPEWKAIPGPHVDSEKKLLTVICYLHHAEKCGTMVGYNDRAEDYQEIEWKDNLAFSFSRQHDVTWHASPDKIYSPRKYTSPRSVVIFNLFDKNNLPQQRSFKRPDAVQKYITLEDLDNL